MKKTFIILFLLLICFNIFSKTKVYVTTNGIVPPLYDEVMKIFQDDKDVVLSNTDYDYEIGLIFEYVKHKTNNKKQNDYIISSVIISNKLIILDHYLLVTYDGDLDGAIKILISRFKQIIEK